MENKIIKIAFIKFGGLSAGGTERWLQMMAANLPKEKFAVDYYYCDAAPYIGSDYKHADTDPARKKYLEDYGINLIKFKVGFKDVTKPNHDWVDTNFWEIFDENKYDIIQTGKAGGPEYPYYLFKKPVVEYVALNGLDLSPNIAWTICASQWSRLRWFRAGGIIERSSAIPVPALPPASQENLRKELDIPENALVAGLLQRNDDCLMSPIPLAAFSRLENSNRYFVIMGGGNKYREQAAKLKLKNIRFLEHSSDPVNISKFFNTLDIFAHGPRAGETFGAVLAEALMHGVPCLSHWSRVSNAQAETMGPGGLFAWNQKEYTQKLKLLFTDKALREKLSAKGHAHAEEYYSQDSAVRELENIYYRVLGLPEKNKNEKIPYAYSKMGFLYSGPLESQASIAFHLAAGSIPEEFEGMITKHFLSRTKTFFDVGANIGIYCFLAARYGLPDAKIFAFEPQPQCIKYLNKTISLNDWENKLSVFNLGLGDKKAELELYLSGTGSTFDNSFNDNADSKKITIPVDTLDNQVEKLNIKKIDFLKIDVEGFEQKVLEGGLKTIERDKPIIFLEIADHVRGRNYRNPNYEKTLGWLWQKGYVIYRADENFYLEKITKPKGANHIAMYLCVPKKLVWKTIPVLRIKTIIFWLTKNKYWFKINKKLKPFLRNKLPWGIVKIIKKIKKNILDNFAKKI